MSIGRATSLLLESFVPFIEKKIPNYSRSIFPSYVRKQGNWFILHCKSIDWETMWVVKIGFKHVKIYAFARNILLTVLMPVQFDAYILCSLLIKDNSQSKLRDKQI